ncbi:MAG: GGDEF domain-containing protein [Blautia sp.]|nr:GGDEF domain-containing protein [Blautia sp.]
MKQFQMSFDGVEEFFSWLDAIKSALEREGWDQKEILFHIYSNTCKAGQIEPVITAIRKAFPQAKYVGATGNGNIIHGASGKTAIGVTMDVFEDPSSRAEVMQLPLSYACQKESAKRFVGEILKRPWVRAVELLTTVGGLDLPLFCEDISVIPEDICVFGGGALATDAYDGHAAENLVFSSGGEMQSSSACFVLMGGPSFYASSLYLTGWKTLGLPFEVTKSHNNELQELNHQAALDLYRKVLDIPMDYFHDLAVIFPFQFEMNGIPCLRVATSFSQDGALTLGADIREHSMCNIAYGDQSFIMENVKRGVSEVSLFSPDIIRLFSCASRQYFWGDKVDQETLPFEKVAPTSGFYTAGEFQRTKKHVVQHNVTLVVAMLREGSKKEEALPLSLERNSQESMQFLINRCLTSFINTATRRLEEANAKLSRMAITDGLTGLYNRTEIERQIKAALDRFMASPEEIDPPIVLMIDLDHFKEINDTYGHQEGDEVLKRVSALFGETIEKMHLSGSAGRWGGEEFMILLENCQNREAIKLAEEIKGRFSQMHFPVSGTHTLSCGLTGAMRGDTTDS